MIRPFTTASVVVGAQVPVKPPGGVCHVAVVGLVAVGTIPVDGVPDMDTPLTIGTLRFGTTVVEVTDKGAVPVATLDVIGTVNAAAVVFSNSGVE